MFLLRLRLLLQHKSRKHHVAARNARVIRRVLGVPPQARRHDRGARPRHPSVTIKTQDMESVGGKKA